MLNFLYSEVWWMETIVAAVITGVVALVGSYFAYFGKTKTILEKIENLKSNLSSSGDSLCKDHDRLSREHGGLGDKLDVLQVKQDQSIRTFDRIVAVTQEAKNTAQKVYDYTLEEKAKQQMRYEALSEKQKSLDALVTNSVDSIKGLHEEFLRVNQENQSKAEEIDRLKQQNEQLTEKLNDSRNQNQTLNRENQSLLETNQRLGDRIEQMLHPAPKPKPRRSGPTMEFDR
ncbi:hypothetical protein U6B65_05675 [Oscillospiraceae bacterium MB08-C2-2]|nr:hypothetical protein U6B65_05675 [Oscillospiraceae bacterium MB08-C2-2]